MRYHTLCKSILKCGFPTKGKELTQFVLFEVLRVLIFEYLGFDDFGRFGTKTCKIQVRLWNKKF